MTCVWHVTHSCIRNSWVDFSNTPHKDWVPRQTHQPRPALHRPLHPLHSLHPLHHGSPHPSLPPSPPKKHLRLIIQSFLNPYLYCKSFKPVPALSAAKQALLLCWQAPLAAKQPKILLLPHSLPSVLHRPPVRPHPWHQQTRTQRPNNQNLAKNIAKSQNIAPFCPILPHFSKTYILCNHNLCSPNSNEANPSFPQDMQNPLH